MRKTLVSRLSDISDESNLVAVPTSQVTSAISLSWAKSIANIQGNQRDEEFVNLLQSARDYIEGITGMSIGVSTYDVALDAMDFKDYNTKGYVELLGLNAFSIESVTIFDVNNVSSVVPANSYSIHNGRFILSPHSTYSMPETRGLDSMIIRCNAGFGTVAQPITPAIPAVVANPAAVPPIIGSAEIPAIPAWTEYLHPTEEIKMAVAQLATFWFKRKSMSVDQSEMPLGTIDCIKRYTINYTALI